MMRQFEAITGIDRIYITVTDTTRWDYFWGFRRVVKQLPKKIP